MTIVYNLKGYPQFVYTAQDFAERKQPKPEQLANLLIRSIFEDGGLGRVLSIDEVTSGTPANGWTIRFTGETNGRTADPYIATYDGEVISYNDDPSRQPRDLSEGLELEFAAKKSRQRNCTKSKPCGGSCIAKGKSCRISGSTISATQKKAADSLAKTKPAKPTKVEATKTKGKRTKASADLDKADAKEKKANADLDKANARIKQIEEDLTKQRAIVAKMRKDRNAPLDEQLTQQRKLNDLLREMPKALEAQSAAELRAFEAKADNLRQKIRREDREIKSIKNRLAWEDRNLYP